MKWLWRISRHADLTGIGGEKASARWHQAAHGKRIVYLAEHPAVCLIESLVNLKGNPDFFPDSFRLLKVSVDDAVSAVQLAQDELPKNWQNDQRSTRNFGDAWLHTRGSALLAVPSAPSPESLNYLLNPTHPDSKGVTVEWHKRIRYDKRLFRTVELP